MKNPKFQTRLRPTLAQVSRKLFVSGIAALLMCWPLPEGVGASAGDLDATFGSSGKVTTDFGGFDDVHALAIQADGKIIAAGSDGPEFAIARYNNDGSLDFSFGDGGKVRTDFFSAGGGFEVANAVAIQPDGKIVAAGFAVSPATSFDFAIARYNEDGSRDRQFGERGEVTTDFSGPGHSDAAYAVVIQSDGRIIVAGSVTSATTFFDQDFGLARYNSDGSLDETFGNGGKAIADFLSFFNERGANDGARALTIQADGKILAVGWAFFDFGIARFNADGNLDKGFGMGGKVVADFLGSIDEALAVRTQAGGKILAAGRAHGSGGDVFALARYSADGTPDLDFGTSGKVSDFFGTGTGESGTGVNGVAFQSDGKIVVSGISNPGPTGLDFGVARYLEDGSVDSSFGVDGKTVTDFGGPYDGALTVAIQPDGKVVAGGRGGANDFALARYDVPADFTLSLDAPIVETERGKKVRVTVTINRLGGFVGEVTVMPPDTSALGIKLTPPDPVSTTKETVKFKLKIKETAQPGTHQIVLTGSDKAGRVRTATIYLTIQ